MLWAGPGVPVRKLRNLIGGLPREARIFDHLEGVDPEVVRWTIERELATATLEVLDVIARKGTKLKKPIINPHIRPGDRRRRKPVAMSDPKAREFFGGRVQYTPKPQDSDPGS